MSFQQMKQEVLHYAVLSYQEQLFAATSGNLSVYDPKTGCMAITPSALPYETMQEADIVILRLDGEVVGGQYAPSSEWRLHAAIYAAMPEVRAVVHTHSPFATAFAVDHAPIPAILAEMIPFLGGGVPVAPFQIPGTPEVGSSVVAALKNRTSCLMANHGVVAVGEDLKKAHIRAVYTEDAAKAYVYAQILGTPQVLSRDDQNTIRKRKNMPLE